MTEQQGIKLLSLSHQMKEIAVPIGSMHSFWDVIMDIEAFIKGETALLEKSAAEWIDYSEKLLAEKGRLHGTY